MMAAEAARRKPRRMKEEALKPKDHKIYLVTVLTTSPCAKTWEKLNLGGFSHLKVRLQLKI